MFKRLAAAILVLLQVPGLVFAQVTVEERLAAGQPPAIIAHRALGGGFPENSLAGIRHAVNSGIDVVEIDVRATRDGRYVLMHDPGLGRMTDVETVFPDNQSQRVADYTLEEIGQLRLMVEPDGEDHPVPSLAEALDLIDGRLLVILDIKAYEVESLLAVLESHGTENLLLFDLHFPQELRDAAAESGIRTYASLKDSHDYLAGLEWLVDYAGPGLAMVSVYRNRLTPEFVTKAAELGVRLSIHGLREEDAWLLRGDPAPWTESVQSGAAALMTGYPDALLELMGR